MRLGVQLIIFLLSGVCGVAQTTVINPVVLYHITEENGLSDNHVQCVLKDHYGFVWIGTADGLNEMDGSRITIFKHNSNDSASINNNDIQCLSEDSSGNIWIGTRTALNKYDRVTHTFTAWTTPSGDYSSALVIKSMVIDKEQNIWLATFGGLFSFNTREKSYHSFFNSNRQECSNCNRLNHLLLDRSGTIWLCSYEGLWSFDTRSQRFKQEIGPGNDTAYEGLYLYVMEDHAGAIWAGGWAKGLKKLDRRTGKVTDCSLQLGDPHRVLCITEVMQGKGHYVLLLNGALKGYDPGNRKFFKYARPLQLSEYPDVTPYYQSADHWVWMISDNGLFIYNPQRQIFRHVLLNDLLVSQSVNLAEWNGQLLVGAQGRDFLKLYDSAFHPARDFSNVLQSFPAQAKGRNASVLSLEQDDKERFWIGSSDGVLNLDLRTGRSQWFLRSPRDSAPQPREFITRLFRDRDGQLWIFPWRDGIWKMDRKDHHFYQALDGIIADGSKKKKLVIADAVQDSAGNIWMADLDEGIILYQHSTGLFSKPFRKQTGERSNASRIFYRKGYCYSVVDKVFMKWKPDLSYMKAYPLPPQMDKAVTDVVPDKCGHWWLASRNGLIEFDEGPGSFQRFTIADGLMSNDMDGTLFCRNDGTLLFAASQYFTLFNPTDLLAVSQSPPQTVLTDVSENGKWVLYDTAQGMQFNYQSNNLLFRWTITDYSNPLHNQFYCRLNGIDADWRDLGYNGEVQYANLSPGNYDLLLRGATANGIMSKNIVHVPFVIHPPFWKTWWFILLCVVAAVILAYMLYRYRLKQAIAVERLRTKISTDLHDDIGSTLSSISILSDMVMKDIHPGPSTEMVGEIKDNSLSLMEKMDDIVWSINPRNDTLENLLLRTRRFAARLFEAKNIDYSIEIQDGTKGIRIPMEYRQHIYLIMKEAINNVVKYAGAGFVSIRVGRDHSCLAVTIGDNGIGFSPSGPPTGNGILSMRHRAALMKAELKIDSAPGKGTLVSLRVKIK